MSAMSNCVVYVTHHREWVCIRKRSIDTGTVVFDAVAERRRRRLTSLRRKTLVPDAKNPGLQDVRPERFVTPVDTAINNPDDYARTTQAWGATVHDGRTDFDHADVEFGNHRSGALNQHHTRNVI